MPRATGWKPAEQDYEEWLGRLDIPLEEETDIETFKRYLADEIGIIGDAQIEALWSAVGRETSYAEHGIRAIRIEYPWGVEVRYGVQGLPGLWGWESIQTMREEEAW